MYNKYTKYFKAKHILKKIKDQTVKIPLLII